MNDLESIVDVPTLVIAYFEAIERTDDRVYKGDERKYRNGPEDDGTLVPICERDHQTGSRSKELALLTLLKIIDTL